MPESEMRQMESEARKFNKFIKELKDLKAEAPEIFGVATGTKLDELFYYVEFDEKTKQFKKKVLGGIPYRSIMNIVGVADTGKSVFAEQFAVYQAARGYKVLFVTVESPAEFLYSSLKQKAYALGLDFNKVESNIVVLDASKSYQLRENIMSVIKTMETAITKKHCSVTIIDSVTGFYEHKEMLARQIVRALFNFLKQHKQTALLVSQKRSSQQAESAEAAGGLAVAHIVDGTIIFDKKLIETRFDQSLYGLPIGSVLRTMRIDGCRLSAHSSDTWVMEITDKGIIEIKEKLSDFIKRKGKS